MEAVAAARTFRYLPRMDTSPDSPEPSRPRYVQVDLDLHADFPLHDLVAAFGDSVCTLHCGEGIGTGDRSATNAYTAVLELNLANRPLTETLRRFCNLIESLPPPAMALWKKARRREFNIGFDSGGKRPAFNTAISHQLITRMSKLRAAVSVTIYPI